MNHQNAIQKGDICRTSWVSPENLTLNLYQGSGRSGACWNAWGLMDSQEYEGAHPEKSRTLWMHADHWYRGNFGADAWLPLGRLTWADRTPALPQDYEQKLTLWDGRLTTRLAGPGGSYRFSSYFDPGNPDILAFEIDYDFPGGTLPPLLFEPSLATNAGFIGSPTVSIRSLEQQRQPAFSILEMKTTSVTTLVALRVADFEGACQAVSDPRGVQLTFSAARGRHCIWLGAANESRRAELVASVRQAEPKAWAASARCNWKKRWGNGWLHIPDAGKQALWARSHYYMLASYNADVRSPAPPMGWSGNQWPYGFPQDLSFIQPALLRLGHLDIAKAWIEFYARTIPSMRDLAQRIFHAEGVMWAWEYPIGEISQLMPGGAPHRYAFQIHNTAYPARMAFETALHLGDPAWSREFAWPVIRESARFYSSLVRRAADGLWDLCVHPASGQDEFDEQERGNYLCSLFSARYALQAGLRMASMLQIEGGEMLFWRNILADGLAFPRLLDQEKGIYELAQGVDVHSRFGVQKHPVQLNPLVFVPPGRLTRPTLRAYELRHQLCIGRENREYLGWTLPAFWLAASHMNDAAGLLDDLGSAVPTRTIDVDHIQIYESANASNPYYITSSGLYCQALQDALVQDYWGQTEFGNACPNEWQQVAFGGLRTLDGETWEGVRVQNGWQITPSGHFESKA